jgi:tRNA (cmo5U34)-methyltransferase
MPLAAVATAASAAFRDHVKAGPMLQVPDAPEFVIPTNWTFRDDGIAAGFERHVRESLPWYDLATGAVAHVARHYLPERGLVYDLGASTGNIGRALAATLLARDARLIPVEMSPEMADRYAGPQAENLMRDDICGVAFESFDVAVMFLTLMFVPIVERRDLIKRLRDACNPGGAIIILDKCEAVQGYAATVLWRLALAGKVATGCAPEDIIAKELSLGGVQRPIARADLGVAVEFFRFGEFAGWLIEG